MAKKILLAGLPGGILMFMWEGLAHEVLPLGQAGLRGLDNEAAVVANLKDNVKQAGLYIFPGGDMLQPGLTGAQKREMMQKATEKFRAGPSGIMVVHPEGLDVDSPRLLITQALLDIGVILLAAFLLSMAGKFAGFAPRLLFVTLLGLVPTLNAELPLWNWYGFPAPYVLSQACIHLVGFFLAGLVVAKLVK